MKPPASQRPLILNQFREHISAVEKLMNFDRDVLDFAIKAIGDLQEKLTQHHRLDNPALTAARSLEMLKGYRSHDSLRSRYEAIFNQALVLLVAYFSSSVHDLFKRAVAAALENDPGAPLLQEYVRVSFRELRDANFEVRDLAPELLVLAKDISFQDMQSIGRAFKECLGIHIDKTADVCNIIVGQACRHVIVHSDGRVNERLLKQVAAAAPRTVKPTLIGGEPIKFSVEEVLAVASSMSRYIETTGEAITTKFGAVV